MDFEYSNYLEMVNDLLANGQLTDDEMIKYYRIRNEYIRINKIDNYKLKEKLLYKGKNIEDKIIFEFARIAHELKEKGYDEFIEDLELLKLQFAVEYGLSSLDYSNILKGIFELEMDMDVNIGLFDEFCQYFKNQLNDCIYYRNTSKRK